MKKYILLMAFILAASFALAAVNTQYIGKAPDLRISITIQDPDPVEPGKEVEASFKIDNNGTTANNVIFEILPEYPFSLVPGENAAKSLGTIGTSQDGKQSVIARYKLKVAQDAFDGNHEIKIRYKIEGFDSWIIIEKLNIKVQSRDAIIGVEKFSAEPSVVAPGSKSKLTITLKNYATSLLKDIKIVLDLGKSGDEVTPFSPIGSTNENVLAYIEPESTKSVEFELIADPGAVSKSYKIPMSIRYSDALGRNYSKSNIITLIVGDEPDISVGIDISTIYTAGAAGEITIKIVNKGLPDIKFVNVKLDKSDKYRVVSPTEVYIGNIDSDDYETADFKMYIEKASENKIVLPLTVEYKDANNKDYKKVVNLELPLYGYFDAKKLGLEKGNKTPIYVLLIAVIIVLVGYFAYRFGRKRSKHG